MLRLAPRILCTCAFAATILSTSACVDGAPGENTCSPPCEEGYTCGDDNECFFACNADGDCEPTHQCDNGRCEPGACLIGGAGTHCNDDDPCTHSDVCTDEGLCAGITLSCDSDACTTRICNGTSSSGLIGDPYKSRLGRPAMSC